MLDVPLLPADFHIPAFSCVGLCCRGYGKILLRKALRHPVFHGKPQISTCCNLDHRFKFNLRLIPALVLAVGYAAEETNGTWMVLSKNARSVSDRLNA